MNLVIAFWLLFVASALVSGLALLQSLRILCYKESKASKYKSARASSRDRKRGSGASSPVLRVLNPNSPTMKEDIPEEAKSHEGATAERKR